MTPQQTAQETISARQKEEKFPIVQYACERAGVARATYYRWYKEDEKFKREVDEAMSDGVGFINDLTEGQLIALIKEKKLPAIALWLRHRHPAFKKRNGDEQLSPVTFKITKY
jgi:hypothetical protein